MVTKKNAGVECHSGKVYVLFKKERVCCCSTQVMVQVLIFHFVELLVWVSSFFHSCILYTPALIKRNLFALLELEYLCSSSFSCKQVVPPSQLLLQWPQ